MRGQKLSIRSSITEVLHETERHFDEDEDEDEDDDHRTRRSEIEKRRAYEKSKRDFEASRKGFSPAGGIFPVKGKSKNSLGITPGECIYFDSGNRQPLTISINAYHTFSKDEKEEQYKIVRSKGKKYRSEKTLCAKIFRLLSKRNKPLHISEIITGLQKIDALNNTYHTYSVVYRTLTRNSELFLRTNKATFYLRKGFRKWPKVEKLKKPSEEVSNNSPSLQDLIMSAVKHLSPDKLTSCPTDVFQLLKRFGFNGQQKTVYAAMQSHNFRKDGFNYRLIADD